MSDELFPAILTMREMRKETWRRDGEGGKLALEKEVGKKEKSEKREEKEERKESAGSQ